MAPASTRRLAGVAVALAILAVAEGLLRVFGVAAEAPRTRFVNEEAERAHAGLDFVADEELFWKLPASRRIVGGAYRTNRLGLRGPDVARPKPARTFRVALVGDSCAFGLGLDDPDTVAARLASFRGPDGARVEVYPIAVPGYSSLQSLGLARRVLHQLDADATVLWIGAFNDAAPACGASDARLAAAARSRVLPVLRHLALFRAIARAVQGPPPECPPPPSAPFAPRVSLDELRANLRALVGLASAWGPVVPLVPPVVQGARAVPYAAAVRRAPGAVEAVFGEGGFQADRIHPNRTGALAVARALAAALRLDGAIDPADALDARRADRADAALADDDAAEALALYETLLPRAADRPRLLAAHASALGAAGRWDEAQVAADLALERHPAFTELRRVAAEAHAARGDDAGALRELRVALAKDHGSIAGRVALARILFAKGRRDEARVVVDEGLRLAPDSPELRVLSRSARP